MKNKKRTPKEDPAVEKEKDVKAEEFTDKGTAYEDDENQLYPEIKEEKGIETGKEGNKPEL